MLEAPCVLVGPIYPDTHHQCTTSNTHHPLNMIGFLHSTRDSNTLDTLDDHQFSSQLVFSFPSLISLISKSQLTSANTATHPPTSIYIKHIDCPLMLFNMSKSHCEFLKTSMPWSDLFLIFPIFSCKADTSTLCYYFLKMHVGSAQFLLLPVWFMVKKKKNQRHCNFIGKLTSYVK